jgi:5'-deoxynucleotidase YfbR-like HD superfamily hydrolase
MNLPFLHHRDSENSLFGLLNRRAIFQNEKPGSGERAQEASQGREELTEAKNQAEQLLRRGVDLYNATPAKEDEKLDPNWPQVDVLIDAIAKRKTAIEGKLEKATGPEKNRLTQLLRKLRDIETGIKTLTTAQRKIDKIDAREKVRVSKASERFQRRFENIYEGGKTMEAWNKRPLYKMAQEKFDEASDLPEFESLWRNEHGVEANKQQASRQLFLALLAEQTNNFTEPSFFGENFTDNPEENIKKYPFLYQEWLKKEHADVLPETLSQLQLNMKEAAAKLNNVDSIESIAQRAGIDSGLNLEDYNKIPSSPEEEQSAQRMDVIERWIYILKKKINGIDKTKEGFGMAKTYEDYIQALQSHMEAEEARYVYFHRLKKKDEVDADFTQPHFASATNRRMAVELAMIKFKKAMDTVDSPLQEGGNFREHYHPVVRRVLIATVFNAGIGQNEIDEQGIENYNDNPGEYYAGMLAATVKSPYFNQNNPDRFLRSETAQALKIAEAGFQAAHFLEASAEVGGLLKNLVDLKAAFKNGNQKEVDRLKAAIALAPAHYRAKYLENTEQFNQIEDIYKNYLEQKGKLENFLQDTAVILGDPDSKKAKTAMEKVQSGAYMKEAETQVRGIKEIAMIGKEDVLDYDDLMRRVEVHYNAQELAESGDLQYFEHLNIRIEGVHGEYLAALQKPEFADMTYDKWGEYLRGTPEDFDKLVKFLETILAGSPGQGKDDFIATFKTLRGNDALINELLGKNGEGNRTFKGQAMALSVFELLRSHLELREVTAGQADSKRAEINKKMEGWNIGDFATHHIENAVDMLVGPGQDISTRIAGGILAYTVYRAFRKAIKGDDAIGKLLRVAGVAAAFEIFLKKTTGEGGLDRLGVDLLEDAMEGTYEGALLQHGEQMMEDNEITEGEHERALENMRDVPFHVLMEWYDATTPVGRMRNKQASGAEYRLPQGLSPTDIVRTDDPKINKEQRASFVLRKTMENFFGYVGNKDDGRDARHGANVMRERWYAKIKDPNYQMQHSDFWLPGVSKTYRGNRDQLTWAIVSAHEIDPQDVEASKGETLAGQTEELAAKAWDGLTEWTSRYGDKAKGAAGEFFNELGDTADDVGRGLGDLVDKGATELYFKKESVKVWYNRHEYEIKRTAGEHWNIIVSGISLPFKFIYVVDKKVMPFIQTKLKQIEQVFSHLHESSITRDLQASDIASNLGAVESSDLQENPEYSYFGEYQGEFLSAFNSGDRFFHSPDRIGYYISETDTTGIDLTNPLYANNPDNVRKALFTKSQEEAIKEYTQRTGLDSSVVEKYLYPIHVTYKNNNPKKAYVFWRMPLNGSEELQKKQDGTWVDYYDPRNNMDRPIFRLDPEKTSWGNLADAMRQDTEGVTGVLGDVASYAVLLPQLGLGMISTGGEIISSIAQAVAGDTDRERKQIDTAIKAVTERPETQRLFMDEFSQSAQSPNRSYSQFYKDPFSAKLYEFSLEFARSTKYRGKLFTGLMLGRTANGFSYEETSSIYCKTKDPRKRYAEMLLYYQETYVKEYGENEALRKVIEDKLKKANTP